MVAIVKSVLIAEKLNAKNPLHKSTNEHSGTTQMPSMTSNESSMNQTTRVRTATNYRL